MKEEQAKVFLDGLIEKESCLIERMLLHHGMPYGPKAKIIIKINVSRYFQFPEVTDSDKEGWSGRLCCSKDFLGGWILELREKGFFDTEIYEAMEDSEKAFLKRERGKYCLHKIYDARIEGLRKIASLY